MPNVLRLFLSFVCLNGLGIGLLSLEIQLVNHLRYDVSSMQASLSQASTSHLCDQDLHLAELLHTLGHGGLRACPVFFDRPGHRAYR